jgi:glycosyltransferase involved in cell wall biosynthesis
MNVLFALYNSLACNSASHVDGIARGLTNLGYDCIVALPENLDDAARFEPMPYRIATFQQMLQQPRRFRDGRGPDIFHAWTPREIVRGFRDRLAESLPFCTVIHLEDNEQHLALCSLGDTQYRMACEDRLPFEFPRHLSHPVKSQVFFGSASGATLLIDRLAECVPVELPHQVFWPAVDRSIYHPRPRNDALRRELGIDPDEVVICYHGNMHPANHTEIRSLYLAVALLNRQGLATRLVRMGSDHMPLAPEYSRWAGQFCISLGYIVDRQRVVDALAMADVYVQPGTSDEFNDYRFPSKLPEFFALGRPVVLPKTNIGLVTRHLTDAYVLDVADGESICAAVRNICTDRQIYRILCEGACEFSQSQFSWEQSAAKVAGCYERIGIVAAAA